MNHRVSDVILLTIAVNPGGLTSSGEDQTQLRQDIEEVLVWGVLRIRRVVPNLVQRVW